MGSSGSKPTPVTFAPSESVTSAASEAVQSVGVSGAPESIPPWANKAVYISAGADDDEFYNAAVEVLTNRTPAEHRPTSITRVEFSDKSVNDNAILKSLFVHIK